MHEEDPMKLKSVATYLGAVAVLATLGGCAAGDGAIGGEDAASSDLPADTAVVRVEQTGGFVTPQTTFSRVPDLAVYADGRAITPGPQIMIYPPPALPNLQMAQLSEAQVERILDLAGDAGLLADDIEYGEPGVADATTTVVTIVSGDNTYIHEAYALAGASTDPSEVALPGVDDEANEARTALTSFIAEASTVAGGGETETTAWEPEAYALQATPAVALPADETGGTESSEGIEGLEGVEGEPYGPALPWEVAEIDLASATTCVAVEGDAAVQLREQFASANALTRFNQAGAEYDVWIRPVYPDETACTASQ
jgi:hypothetical protein